MTEVAPSLPDLRTVSQEKLEPTPVKRGGRWGRATLAMSAAMLATACTTTSVTHPSETPRPPGITQSSEAHGPVIKNVSETFKSLDQNTQITKNPRFIDITPISSQFKQSDYVPLNSKDPTTHQETYIDEGSAPLVDIHYDKATGQLVYQDQTPNGLSQQQLYDLLLPLERNSLILQTALTNGDVTRIAIRLEAPLHLRGANEYTSDAFVQNDYTQPERGVQKTVFLFLPGTNRIDMQQLVDTMRHETLHSFTQNDTLSQQPDSSTRPSTEQIKQWNGVCVDIRNIAVQQAEQHDHAIINDLYRLQDKLHNPIAKAALAEVTNAVLDGSFDNFTFQPNPSDNLNKTPFTAKVPDCRTIGPWESFVRLMQTEGHTNILDHMVINNEIGNLSSDLHDGWQKIMEQHTIFKILREGTYDPYTKEKLLGHPFDDWDELITSIADVSIAYPDALAANISKLTPGQHEVALKLVEKSLHRLQDDLPDNPANQKFRDLISQRLATIIHKSWS